MSKIRFDEVLVTNRGIIGLRVIETLKKMGIKSVAVYTPDDANSMHVKKADEKYCIRDYREFAEVLQVADHLKKHEEYVIGVHPGYGFLSEDVDFAEVCDEHFVFIGPSFKIIKLMGDKIAAKESAKKAGVPTIPDSGGAVQSEKQALEIAEQMGFPKIPIMIKSAGGGGGMGIVEVDGKEKLEDIIKPYREIGNYAKLNFNNSEIYFERLIKNPRHIEIQILADKFGNVISLGERDCSIQRRHQKLIEYSPADISDKIRQEMESAAIRLAKEVGYVNAGTVEFLVQGDEFYFMEVNTRIQVEHRVTEVRYGIDIVEEQLRIAAGEKLRYRQEDLTPKGFALECRVNAEDPRKDFEACPGKVKKFNKPKIPGVVIDSHLSWGYKIPHRYDSLIANVISHGDTKEEAVKLMQKALSGLKIKGDGLKTTIPYHIREIRNI